MLYLSNKSGKLPLFSLSLSQKIVMQGLSRFVQREKDVFSSLFWDSKKLSTHNLFIHIFCFLSRHLFLNRRKKYQKLSRFMQRKFLFSFLGLKKNVYSSLKGTFLSESNDVLPRNSLSLCLTIVTVLAEFPGVVGSLHAYRSMLRSGTKAEVF